MSDPAVLGRGWAFPPSFSLDGSSVETVSGTADIEQSLRLLLGTAPGERIMQESFGCDLRGLLFEELDQSLINTLERLVEDAILNYEPRIRFDRLDVQRGDVTQGSILLRIYYTVNATNTRYNLVFPFYLTEATLQPAV